MSFFEKIRVITRKKQSGRRVGTYSHPYGHLSGQGLPKSVVREVNEYALEMREKEDILGI